MIRRSTWFLLGVSILIIAAAVFWNRSRQAQETAAEPTSALEFLFDAPEEEITGFRVSTPDGAEVEVHKSEQGTWMLNQPESDRPDTDRIESVLLELSAFRVITKINSQLDKNIIGLDPPRYNLYVELNNGETIQVFIGDETPTPGGYYAFVQGQPAAVVNSFSIESVIDLIENPPILSTPTPTSSN